MNTKEKKKLKHKYVNHIKYCIDNFDTLYKGENIDISYFEELLMYSKLCDHITFYNHYQKRNWPPKGSHLQSYNNADGSGGYSIKNLREDKMLNRIVMLKELGI